MTAQAAGPLEPSPTADRQLLDEPAAMRFLPSGMPLALRWRGNIWQGSLITTRSWRFQAQTGPASPVLELDISADPRWQGWRLHRVAGAPGF
jgi:hypothetical protein